MLEEEFEGCSADGQPEVLSTFDLLKDVTKSRAAKFFFQLCGASVGLWYSLYFELSAHMCALYWSARAPFST